jgi:MinD superfamily P-loop ATPase
MHIPAGVVVNRVGIGNEEVDEYLADKNIPVLLHVPFSKELATGIAAGKNLIEILPEYQQKLQNVFQTITGLVNGERS